MGTGAFIYASNYSEYGLAGTGVLGPGATLMYVIVKIYREVSYRVKNKAWVKPQNSSWFKDDGKVRWNSMIPLFGNIACNIGYTIVMTFAWGFAD